MFKNKSVEAKIVLLVGRGLNSATYSNSSVICSFRRELCELTSEAVVTFFRRV